MPKRKLRLGVMIGVLGIAAVFATWLVIWGRERLNERNSASYLSALGQVMLLYQNEHTGKYPPDWGTLAKEEDVPARIFVCPSSTKSAPSNLTLDQLADWINSNSDYVYLEPDFPQGNDHHIVLAYEKLENHHGHGINVLFKDGVVRFFGHNEANKIIADLKAHINPPRLQSEGKTLFP